MNVSAGPCLVSGASPVDNVLNGYSQDFDPLLQTVNLQKGLCKLRKQQTSCMRVQILALPKGAVLLATSPTAPFEAWSYGPNILALQGHCEFEAQTTLEKIHATLTVNGQAAVLFCSFPCQETTKMLGIIGVILRVCRAELHRTSQNFMLAT